jgi:hypothetical protein
MPIDKNIEGLKRQSERGASDPGAYPLFGAPRRLLRGPKDPIRVCSLKTAKFDLERGGGQNAYEDLEKRRSGRHEVGEGFQGIETLLGG